MGRGEISLSDLTGRCGKLLLAKYRAADPTATIKPYNAVSLPLPQFPTSARLTRSTPCRDHDPEMVREVRFEVSMHVYYEIVCFLLIL
jgi:hypothetical protein